LASASAAVCRSPETAWLACSYLKEDRALRMETVVNDPGDLGCKRSLDIWRN